MEVPQGDSLCSYLKQAKVSFFFYEIGEQEVEQILPKGVVSLGGGGGGERCGR
jgi:hypothetical protein